MFNGKVAIVTGAGRGIGCAIAKALAAEGAAVVVNYNGSSEKAAETADYINNNGGSAKAVRCNVADFDACGEFIKSVAEEYGRIDILVNNAGITKDGLIMRMSEADYDKVLDINLKGTFNMIRHASRYMMRQRAGKIINISSVSGVLGNAGQSNYSASKAGVIGLTKSVAKELASRNINVNAIAPGFIKTDMTEAMNPQTKEGVIGQIPLGRIGSPEDIADMAVFLASDKADYITGQVISVDGGMVM